jgi:hypothetical protein
MALAIVLAAAAVLVVTRKPLLRAAGHLLVSEDPLQPSDVAVMTFEAGRAGEIELARLYQDRLVPRVGVLLPAARETDRELRRRGISLGGPEVLLMKLGVPESAIELIPAAEGGTTDGTAALAAWWRSHPVARLTVVTSCDHSHRTRRALARRFGPSAPALVMRCTQYDAFRADDWWRKRTTLRTGLVELEKILIDYVRHPLQ